MKIGITRIRNEEHIIKDTLDHVSKLVDGIIVYDDASEDNTVEICKNHPAVIQILQNELWDSDPVIRGRLERVQRQLLYNAALKRKPDWIYYFDADEFASFEGIDFKADVYRLRLFDFYITEKDKNLTWKERKYVGPEYREILMLFRPHPGIRFVGRIPKVPKDYIIKRAGEVKHYGKAISVEEWEKTCKYYINNRHPQGKFGVEKWKSRVGKAIHTVSDFGNPLITWEERKEKGFKLKKRK